MSALAAELLIRSAKGFLATFISYVCVGFPHVQKNHAASLSVSPFSLPFVLFTQTAGVSLRERQDSIDKDSNTKQQRANLTSNTMRI